MERFKNYVWLAAGFVILAATISAFVPGAALAQIVKAALVKNVDERGRVPYGVQVSCDASFGSCVAYGPLVPTGKRLVLQHVSARVSGTTNLAFFFTDKTTGFQTFVGLPVVLNLSNETVLAYIEAGDKPALTTFSANPVAVDINGYLSGYLVDLTI